MKRLLLSLLFASAAAGQTIQVQGGASSLLNAEGGAVTAFLPNSTAQIGAGISNGHIVAAASERFSWKGWEINAGDEQLFLQSGSAGFGIAERGAALQRKGPNGTVDIFSGACGRLFSTPFFAGAEARHFCSGYAFRKRFHQNLEIGSVGVSAAGKTTALESATWHAPCSSKQPAPAGAGAPILRFPLCGVTFSGSGGLLEKRAFANGQGLFQSAHFAATISRTNYLFQNQQAGVTNEGLAALFGPLDLHASAFQSKGVPGETAGGGLRMGFLSMRADEFWSAQGRNFSGSISQQIGRHFRVSEYVNRSAGQTTFSAGGGFQSNWLSASVDHTVLYSIFTGKFQNATVVTLSFRLHDSTVNLGTVNGKWSAYGGQYIQTGLQLAGESRHAGFSGHIVAGYVRDANGARVEGAAVEIGGHLVFSDSDGYFFTRFRKTKPVAVRIRPDDFAAPGTWRLLAAPDTALPGDSQPISVVVERL